METKLREELAQIREDIRELKDRLDVWAEFKTWQRIERLESRVLTEDDVERID